MKSKSIYISGHNQEIAKYFEKVFNMQTCPRMVDAHLVVFGGGADIDPKFYNETKHSKTGVNAARDLDDENVFNLAHRKGKAMVGICRGAQYLHAKAGGYLHQHVDNHRGPHQVFVNDLEETKVITVSSTHHQMMADKTIGEVLMFAPGLASVKEGSADNKEYEYDNKKDFMDIEAMSYPLENSLSFQPHPEFVLREEKLYSDCSETFKTLIFKCLEL